MKYCFIADENDEGTRLDSYLSGLFGEFSRSQIQQSVKNSDVLVNNLVKKPSYNIRNGDRIDFEAREFKGEIVPPQDIPLEIVYEDENMLVVNKPSGMLTHPTPIEHENTLVNALLHRYGENLSDINGFMRRGILHRLDRNTSGLLMIAKNNKAHEFLAAQIKDKTAIRSYRAFVKGVMKEDSGVINFPIGRHPTRPHKMAVVENGKPCITEFEVIKRFKDCTYLQLTLKTGRTHQIRVHLSQLHHPVLNDTLYGAGQFKVKTQEQVLQAYKLIFTKPFSNDIINLEIPPDEKIIKVLAYLESKK